MHLFKDIYTFTDTWPTPPGEKFSQVMDIRRAAMALPNYLTDWLNGQPEHPAELLSDTRETLAELEGHLLAARNRDDLVKEDFDPLLHRIDRLRNMLQDIASHLAKGN